MWALPPRDWYMCVFAQRWFRLGQVRMYTNVMSIGRHFYAKAREFRPHPLDTPECLSEASEFISLNIEMYINILFDIFLTRYSVGV